MAVCPLLTPVPADDPLPGPLDTVWPIGHPVRYQPRPTLTSEGFYTRVVRLTKPLDGLWRDIRRSYHALIHRAQERYTFNEGNVPALRRLYDERSDLPQLTARQWEHLDRMHAAKLLRIYVSYARSDVRLVGAMGIYIWKRWAYYGHGRSLANGVSHMMQWEAIRHIRDAGHPFYEVGWMEHAGDDEKARRIAHFKAGFGGESWWVPVSQNGSTI